MEPITTCERRIPFDYKSELDVTSKREAQSCSCGSSGGSFPFDCSPFRERGLINERDRTAGRRAYIAENVIPERPNFPALEIYLRAEVARDFLLSDREDRGSPVRIKNALISSGISWSDRERGRERERVPTSGHVAVVN